MNILVTGGCGFIGGHLVDRLVKNHDVTVWDDMSNGMYQNKMARYTLRDVRSTTSTSSGPFDVVFHLAAQIDVRKSVDDPQQDASVNVMGTLHMLEYARAWGAKFIFASSGGALYGDVKHGYADEFSHIRPYSPYAASKAAGETYCKMYENLWAVPTFSLRLGNVYGPRQAGGENGVIKIFLDTNNPTVYGDGTQERDYVYVDDVVDAFVAAMTAHPAAITTCNIGTGVSTSVNSLLKIMGKTGSYDDARPGDLQRSALNVKRASETLGWTHKTPLQYGIESMMWTGDDRAVGFR